MARKRAYLILAVLGPMDLGGFTDRDGGATRQAVVGAELADIGRPDIVSTAVAEFSARQAADSVFLRL